MLAQYAMTTSPLPKTSFGFGARTLALASVFMIYGGLHMLSPSQMVMGLMTIVIPSLVVAGMLSLLSCLIWPPFDDAEDKPRDK